MTEPIFTIGIKTMREWLGVIFLNFPAYLAILLVTGAGVPLSLVF